MTDTASPIFTQRYTKETGNVAAGSDVRGEDFDWSLLDYEQTGDFFGFLEAQDYSLCVTREYEHFSLFLDGVTGRPHQSPFPLPHPSGVFYDENEAVLYVSSTRTPNIIMEYTQFADSEAGQSILPDDFDENMGGALFLSRRAQYLPGTLYIHDIVKMGGDLYATITGHNFLARLSPEIGWKRAWWPKKLDEGVERPFATNFFQLNSIAIGATPEESYYTAFSDLITGAKPWKEGYGPNKKGVVFSGKTREPAVRGLTCPHSAKLYEGRLWLCDSGYGQLVAIDGYEDGPESARIETIATLPGFTRGLAIKGDYAFVGLSKVIDKYEPYAPGLKPADTKCGICIVNIRTGKLEHALFWPTGYQIYDVQIMPKIKQPRFPLAASGADGVNRLLRFVS